MRSKEAIRNKIIRYINLVWNTEQTSSFNPLIHLLIEEICNELYLLDNRLIDIDSAILEKLVHKLSPSVFNYVRPSHGILCIKPDIAEFKLMRKSEFFLKEIPFELKNKFFTPPTFTPVTNVNLVNLSVQHLFFDSSLWKITSTGEKSLITHTKDKASYNTLWIQFEHFTNQNILRNLSIYVDFKHLNTDHDYYDAMVEAEWTCSGKSLRVQQGLYLDPDTTVTHTEQSVLDYYKKHYWTICDSIFIDQHSIALPTELHKIMDEEVASSIPQGLWLCLKLPAYFTKEDIENLFITINAFPILNRRFSRHVLLMDDFTGITTLPSEPGEEFLEIEVIKDSLQNIYIQDEIVTSKDKGVYSIEAVRKKDIDDNRIYDYLERFIDTLQNERSVFPNIDEDKVQYILNTVSDAFNKENHKININRLNEYAEVAKLSISPQTEINSISIDYWISLADQVNGLPKGEAMMANKIPALNKSDALLITPLDDGRTFYDVDSLKAINAFYTIAKGQVVTKYSIISFCQIEIGKYCTYIDIVRKAQVSNRHKEGIINIMEVQLTPKSEYIDYINKKGVLNDLLTRLAKKSPPHYRYVIKIVDNIQ